MFSFWLELFLKYTDIVDFHLLGEFSARIRISRPDATYSNIKNEEMLQVKLA